MCIKIKQLKNGQQDKVQRLNLQITPKVIYIINNIIRKMHPIVAVIAMVNGMIGGLILVLPILAMQGGSVLSFIVILVTGFFSYYSCYLCVAHLGCYSDLDRSIFNHFNKMKWIKIFYDAMVCVNLALILLLYFNLIVEQWQGLIPKSQNNDINPICNIVFLLILVSCLKYIHFGAKLLGYGIISIISYCIFLIWLLASAPSGPKTIPQFGTGAVNLAASMGQAFSIQTFFIPVLRYLPSIYEKSYQKYTLIAYIIGGGVYLYIAYAGSFGIVNRSILNPKLQTIQAYFSSGQWQVQIIQVIYLVHLYSAFGQFLLVSMKRFFSILQVLFGVRHSKHGQFFTIPQAIYILLIMIVTFVVYLLQVPIDDLISINGAVIGFFFIYLIPAVLHFKCLYFTHKSPEIVVITNVEETQNNNVNQKQLELTERNKSNLQQQFIPGQDGQKKQQPNNGNINQIKLFVSDQSEKRYGSVLVEDSSPTLRNSNRQQDVCIQQLTFQCQCRKPKLLILQILDILCVFIMVLLGLFIMVDGIISLNS